MPQAAHALALRLQQKTEQQTCDVSQQQLY
jgi:hypothetical protein